MLDQLRKFTRHHLCPPHIPGEENIVDNLIIPLIDQFRSQIREWRGKEWWQQQKKPGSEQKTEK